MFDRDRYWVQRLYELIAASPGIDLKQLTPRTRKLNAQERLAYLEHLSTSGRVHAIQQGAWRGAMNWRFWPVTAPPIAKPADQLATALADAKRLLTAALAAVDSAARIASEAATAAGGPMPAPDRGLVGDVETAMMPAVDCELRAAC
jgi:hypothetical protein